MFLCLCTLYVTYLCVKNMLIKLSIVAFIAALVHGDESETLSAAQRFPADGKIVGGVAAEQGEIPWQIAILNARGSLYCGGSIINENWIMTAAHCSNINSWMFRIRSGSVHFGKGGRMHNIIRIIKHDNFNANNLENDIALWKVEPAFSWDNTTGPVKLPAQDSEMLADTLVWVSGWGTTSSGGSVSERLLKVDVSIVDKVTCDTQYSKYGGIPPNQICAGHHQGGKDSCQGDSGGPLFVDGTQLGVVSWGNGCARPDYPGVYTEVAAYRTWINDVAGI